MCTPQRSWLTSLTACPSPTRAPQWTTLEPIASRTGRSSSKRSCGPPAIMSKSPFSARATPPLTGASSARSPRPDRPWASSRIASGPIVLMATTAAPSGRASAAPPSPKSTPSACSAFATIRTSPSTPVATSCTDDALAAPSSTSGRTRSSRTSKTPSSKPVSLFAMGRPIAPSPTNPRRCTATTPSLSPTEGGKIRLHDLLHSLHDAVAEALEVQLRRLRAEFLPQAPEVRRPKLGVDVELGYPQRDRAPQITLGEPGGAVQGEGDRARAPDLSQPPPVEFRDAGVVAVDVAHRYREAVHAALPGEPPGLVRIGRLAAQGLPRLVLLTLDPAELGLDPDAAGSHRAHHGPGEGEVLAEGELRAVGHHGVHPTVGGSLYQALVPDVVELHEDVRRGAPGRGPEGPHEPLAAFRPEGRRAHEDYHRRSTGLGGSDHRL